VQLVFHSTMSFSCSLGMSPFYLNKVPSVSAYFHSRFVVLTELEKKDFFYCTFFQAGSHFTKNLTRTLLGFLCVFFSKRQTAQRLPLSTGCQLQRGSLKVKCPFFSLELIYICSRWREGMGPFASFWAYIFETAYSDVSRWWRLKLSRC